MGIRVTWLLSPVLSWLLTLVLCFSLVFWHSQVQTLEFLFMVTKAWGEGRRTLTSESTPLWEDPISQYKSDLHEVFHTECIWCTLASGARWLVLLPITSRSTDCPFGPSCVLSTHSLRAVSTLGEEGS